MKSKYFGEKIQNDSQKWNSIFILLVVIVSFGVYANALFNGFVFDDIQLIVNNDAIKSYKYIPEIFTGNLWGLLGRASNYYRPLPPLIYMVIYSLFGTKPWAFHLINIVLHTGTSILVFLILRSLLAQYHERSSITVQTASLIAALLFAVHPIHTEAVSWIAGIMDVSCAFFALLSFYFYVSSETSPTSITVYLLSLVSFFLAALSKEPALTLPIIIVIYSLTFLKQTTRTIYNALTRCAPYFLVLGVYLLMRLYALKGLAPLETSSGLTAYQGAINVVYIFAQYVGKLLVPVQLNVLYYLHPISSIWNVKGLISLLLTLIFIGCASLCFRKNKVAFLGFIFVVLPLVPVLYLPALIQKIEYAMADRYLYFSSFGFVILIAVLFAAFDIGNRKGVIVAVSAVIVVFSIMTFSRNYVWKSNVTLWSDSVQKSPESAFAHENLGYALFYEGRAEEGKEELRTALALDPGILDAILNAGIAYSAKGLINNALFAFQRVILLRPDSVEGHYNLGVAYNNKGLLNQAIEQYRAVLRMKPDHVDAHVNLGIAYGQKGLIDQAIEHLETAVRLNAADPFAHHNLANAYRIKGLPGKAQEHLQKAKNLQRK
jgi:tetratricopeptide (TPR) repeat protein